MFIFSPNYHQNVMKVLFCKNCQLTDFSLDSEEIRKMKNFEKFLAEVVKNQKVIFPFRMKWDFREIPKLFAKIGIKI